MPQAPFLPRLAIGALGGTLSMKASQPDAGVTPAVDAQAMLQAVPPLAALAQVYAQTLHLIPSASLTFAQLLDVLHWANAQVQAGAHGVVITQGTDTLEESAWFLDLLWPHEAPLIVTGAMRPASHVSADGPGNLLNAAITGLDPASRGRGVLVVMNEDVHGARHVRKTHALAIHAFTSPGYGAVGSVVEERVRYRQATRMRQALPVPVRTDHKVALLEATLDGDTLLLDQIVGLGYAGLVVNGFGAGHVSQAWAGRLGEIAGVMPVVVATRAGEGATARGSYGFVGGEIDLQARGVLMAGELDARKVRILMWLLIGSGMQANLQSLL